MMTELLSDPLMSIGKYFNRDHTTVGYARNKICELMKTDNELVGAIAVIKNIVTN